MKKFKTESKKLLDLMINSIYTNKEIFLRELISNASDAVDKLYFKSLTDTDVKLSKDELAIHVSFDKDARTITVSDSGIGMTKDELEKNLGTIAHSGYHRPVRRGLLFRIHGCQGSARCEPRIRQRRGVGVGQRRR